MKLFDKYNRFLLPSFILILVMTFIVTYILIKNVIQEELDAQLYRAKFRTEKTIEKSGIIPVTSNLEDIHIVWTPVKTLPEEKDLLEDGTIYIPEQKKQHLARKLTFVKFINGQAYKISISKPLEGTKHITKVIEAILLVSILSIILLFSITNRFILSKIWKPFYDTLFKISRFQLQDQHNIEFSQTNIDEFKLLNNHLSKALNTAVNEFKVVKEFNENASHEIQTPLAIIRSNLENIFQKNILDDEMANSLNSMSLAISKLSRLHAGLLLLSRIENNQFHLSHELNISTATLDIVEELKDLSEGMNITWDIKVQPGTIFINSVLFEILLQNLITNAIKYNFNDGKIHVSFINKRLTISNTSKEPKITQEKLFRRFAKNDKSTSSNGLGLSIVHTICKTQGLEIEYTIKNEEHIFSIIFPSYQEI